MKQNKILSYISIFFVIILLWIILLIKPSNNDLEDNIASSWHLSKTTTWAIISNNILTTSWTTLTNNSKTWSIVTIKKSIKEIIAELDTNQSIIKKLNNDKDYNNELQWLNKYYSSDAPFEFYIYSAIKNNNKTLCDSINDNIKKTLCYDIFKYHKDKSTVIPIIIKSWATKEDAEDLYILFQDITNNLCSGNYNFINYLACKKINNKNFDVDDYFLKYKILEYANLTIVNINYEEIIKYWKLDKDFSNLIKNQIVPKNDKLIINLPKK